MSVLAAAGVSLSSITVSPVLGRLRASAGDVGPGRGRGRQSCVNCGLKRARRYTALMAARLGVVLYWLAIIVALLLAALGVVALFGETPLMSLIAFIPAGIVWAIGRAILYVLAGDRGARP